jgi:hypothetical protein
MVRLVAGGEIELGVVLFGHVAFVTEVEAETVLALVKADT